MAAPTRRATGSGTPRARLHRPSLRLEKELLRGGCARLAAMDEVGRGALAGPVTVGVVVVTASIGRVPAGLRDSKLLTPAARERLVAPVRRWAVEWAVGHASPAEIDAHGIMTGLRWAAHRALAQLSEPVDAVLLDGNHDYLNAPAQRTLFEPGATGPVADQDRAVPATPAFEPIGDDEDIVAAPLSGPEILDGTVLAAGDSVTTEDSLTAGGSLAAAGRPVIAADSVTAGDSVTARVSASDLVTDVPILPVHLRVKADLRCAGVAAASVLAKTTRDAMMVDYATGFPAYGWAVNKGYATPEHLAALAEHGPCELHRRSWRLSRPAPDGAMGEDGRRGGR